MENIESLGVAHESPNSRKEQRDFIASVLLEAVNESFGDDGNGKRKAIPREKVEKARRYLLTNPIAHLYFILLDINIDAALSSLQRKWQGMDPQYRPSSPQPRVLH